MASTAASTALSMPRFTTAGLVPVVTTFKPAA